MATKPFILSLAALAMVAVATPHARADGDHLGQARAHLDRLEYSEALRALERALASGNSGPDELIELHRLLGEVNAALGHAGKAEEHFRALLALQPDVRLPAGSSPKLTGPFDAARDHLRALGRLDVRCEGERGAQEAVLRVITDPVGLVAGARALVRVDGREQIVNASGSTPIALTLPRGSQDPVQCAALDSHGNRLIEMRMTPAFTPAAPGSAPVTASAPDRSIFARWHTWGGVTVVGASAGAYFGLRARADQRELDRLNADSMEHYFEEAEAVERRGKRNALLANISLGVTGAGALVTAILLVRGDPARSDRAVALSPMLAPAGTGVSLSLSF